MLRTLAPTECTEHNQTNAKEQQDACSRCEQRSNRARPRSFYSDGHLCVDAGGGVRVDDHHRPLPLLDLPRELLRAVANGCGTPEVLLPWWFRPL